MSNRSVTPTRSERTEVSNSRSTPYSSEKKAKIFYESVGDEEEKTITSEDEFMRAPSRTKSMYSNNSMNKQSFINSKDKHIPPSTSNQSFHNQKIANNHSKNFDNNTTKPHTSSSTSLLSGFSLDAINLPELKRKVDEICLKICGNDTRLDSQNKAIDSTLKKLEEKETKLVNFMKNLANNFLSIEKSKSFIQRSQQYLNCIEIKEEPDEGGLFEQNQALQSRIIELEQENRLLKSQIESLNMNKNSKNYTNEMQQLVAENLELKENIREYDDAFAVQEEKIHDLETKMKQLLTAVQKKIP